MTITPIREIIMRVENWARVHVPEEFAYNSRMTYYNSAFSNKIITKNELEDARIFYGRLWDYVGD
jgi:hypothetical protein